MRPPIPSDLVESDVLGWVFFRRASGEQRAVCRPPCRAPHTSAISASIAAWDFIPIS